MIPGGLAHVLHHDVYLFSAGYLPDLVRDLLAVVINHVIGPKLSGFGHFALISGACNHPAMKQFRDLNARNPNS